MKKSCKNVLINEDLKEMLHRGTPGFPCEAYYENIMEFSQGIVGWHWHEEIELIAVKSGCITVSIGDGSSSFLLEAGEGAFINTNVLHTVRKYKSMSSEVISFVFHPSLIAASPASSIHLKYVQPLLNLHSLECIPLKHTVSWHKEAAGLIFDAYETYMAKTFGYEIFVREAFSKIFLIILSHTKPDTKEFSAAAARDEERMRQMLSFIQENYAKPLTPLQIASSANISQRECYRCFQRTICQTPLGCLLQYRLQTASSLLAQTDLPVTEISLKTGFNSPSYFTKMFTKHMKITPSSYRSSFRGDAPSGSL